MRHKLNMRNKKTITEAPEIGKRLSENPEYWSSSRYQEKADESLLLSFKNPAGVLKLVDKPDLGSGAERRMGSIPFARTKRALILN